MKNTLLNYMDIQLKDEWSSVFHKTIAICTADEFYASYSAREKMLAFTFTFLQSLQSHDTDFSQLIRKQKIPFLNSGFLKAFRREFDSFADELILDATNSGEIQARPFIASFYKPILWNALVGILHFWASDTSEMKENTDVMVEKTIHFTFDLFAPNPIDSGIDLLQYFIKIRKRF